MPTIAELMAASKAALAANNAAAAAAASTTQAVETAAAAGGAGEGAAAITDPAAQAAKGNEGGDPDEEAKKAAAAAAAGTTAAAVVAPSADQGLQALVKQVTDTTIENGKLSAQVEALNASCLAMVAVVSDSLDRMSIALGGGKVDISAMTPEALVAQHVSTAATFAAKFPIGGVAAVPINADEEKKKAAQVAADDFDHQRRVAATMGGTPQKK